uniref:C-type lectin domain-containing protein n=1 Tax=Panagrolaimus sp. JU765 TaxID=591449 RepID=A0AC34R5X8_9BILA
MFFDDSDDEHVANETKIVDGSCPDGWKLNMFDDVAYCYLAVTGAYVDQSEAQQACENQNSSLVSIHSEDEHKFVYCKLNG